MTNSISLDREIERDIRRQNHRLLIADAKDPSEHDPIVVYIQEPLLSLAEAYTPLIDIVHNIFMYVSIALERTSDKPADGLTRSESAAIRLYTMEWDHEHESLYSLLNVTHRKSNSSHLRPWHKYLKLLLTAIVKIPCLPPQVVWRGVRRDITHVYQPGSLITWWAFSSCTITLPVLENMHYLGTEGERTLCSIEVINGRNIRGHSYFAKEDEIMMLPGTKMEVQSKFIPAPDLRIIHLKQIKPEEILLESPFEGRMNFFL